MTTLADRIEPSDPTDLARRARESAGGSELLVVLSAMSFGSAPLRNRVGVFARALGEALAKPYFDRIDLR